MRTSTASTRSRGFALIVSLSLMILLTVIAVGLLTLASISLRAGSRTEAQQRAQANARLALALALGTLQRDLGPDQRISAPASLVDPEAPAGLTGAWESWAPDPLQANDYARRRVAGKATETADGEFLGWLQSTLDGQPAADPAAPPPAAADGVPLLPAIGTEAPGKIPPVRVAGQGALAWAVVDEGVKARFDLPAESSPPELAETSRLRAPGRNAAEVLDGLDKLRLDAEEAAKTLTLAASEISIGKETVRKYRAALTPYAASVMCDVAAGGLKKDLTRAFEAAAVPTEMRRQRVYSQTDTPFSDADPYMSALAGYYRLYKDVKDRKNPLEATAPRGYAAFSNSSRGVVPRKGAPQDALILPVVSKVQVVFSLISREAHGNWAATIPSRSGDPNRRFMVYLIYTPVITVSNPYDVPLSFSSCKVTFRNLPVAFKIFRNRSPQTNNPFLLGQAHLSSQNDTGFDDPFSVTLATAPGATSTAPVTLRPGEARVFGITHPATATFGSMTNFLWENDLHKSRTLNVTAGSGWDFRSGFIVDWLAPAGAGQAPDNFNLGVIGIRNTDTVDIECSPKMPTNSGGRFSVEVEAVVAGSRRPTLIACYDYKYGNERRLREIFEKGRNPVLGEVTYPFRPERPWRAADLYQPNSERTPVKDWTGPKQFAVFTLADRAAQDSQYPGKPGRQSSFVHNLLEMDATSAHPGRMPMEVSLLPIRTAGANTVGSIDADAFDRAYFYSGNRQATGSLSVPTYQIPTAPLVNMADFRHANLAAGGYLPLTAYTVGESAAPAMVQAAQVRTATDLGYEALDHAWLANSRLWDAYYLSALVGENDATAFFDGTPLLHNPRFLPYRAPGVAVEQAAAAIAADDGWKKASAHQLLRGGFNVNSTSADAWRAVLSSHAEASIPTLNPLDLKTSASKADRLPLLRTLVPTAGDMDADPSNTNRWGGFRNLAEEDVDKLAAAIVEQVRKHGPFLSMSDFLNRRLTSESDPASAGGALELAIARAGISTVPSGMASRAVTPAEAQLIGFANPTAAAGDTEEGSRAHISQGDLMSMVGGSFTVRSDTFTIRAYGEATDASGKNILARAWCEAVVQRLPGWVDSADAPETAPANLLPVNLRFGRRFEVVSFRWLAQHEI